MTSRPLPTDEARRLSSAPLTYPDVGGTSLETFPGGYHHLERSARLGQGAACFEDATLGLLTWRMHHRAGLRISASSPLITEGTVAVLRIGVGPLALQAPVRVLSVPDEPRRRGFTYGTLPGHPESGEESFLVEWHDDDRVTLTIRAFSRPATALSRLAGPLGRAAQAWTTRRYLRALRG